MASSIAIPINLGDLSYEELQILRPKKTAIDKIGGILCHICNSIFGNKKDYDNHYGQHNTGSAEIIYTCVVCKKHISNYPSFRGHCYLSHVVKNKFQCKNCSKKFSKMCILNSHISAVHDHKCPSCNDKFTSKRDLEIHKKIIHNDIHTKVKSEPPYDCAFCGTVIKTVDMCQSHIDNHCEMLYPCPICKDVLPSKMVAIKHLTKHFDEKLSNNISTEPSWGEDSSIDILGGILCCHCNLLCRNRAEINMHFNDEHNGKPVVYTCNVCQKPYDKYDLFGNHCYDHFARGKFQCDQCNKTFSRLSLLVIHTEAFHTDCLPDKPFGCERCGHGYMTSLRLQEHLRIVHQEEGSRSRCMKPGCSAIFEKPRDLIQHLKDHNPVLDNWCKQCGLQFTSLSSAEKHLDIHRHKQYSCPICKHEYGEKYLMVKHVPTHFETVLHICKTCGKGYNARNRLIHHLKSHSETRSHKCTFCSKSFIKPHELEQHLNIHTGRKPYPCTLCQKTFANYPNWSKHLSRVHLVEKKKIKQWNMKLRAELVETMTKTSPTKPESGIESAGSELSDVYTFVESDESADDGTEKDWSVQNYNGNVITREIDANGDPISGENISIADTVKAAIDRLDFLGENLDWVANEIEQVQTSKCVGNTEFITVNITQERLDDDSNDIRAIVEHIDAMSGDMETVNHVHSIDSVPELNVAMSGEMETVNHLDAIDSVPELDVAISGEMETVNHLDAIDSVPELDVAMSGEMETVNHLDAIDSVPELDDAMSGEMETVNHLDAIDSVPELEIADPEILEYADMMPADNIDFNTISEDIATLPEVTHPSGCLPEYGPDVTEGLTSVDDHFLPHIDPLLTIKAQNNAKMYVQNLNNYNFDDVTAPIDYGAQESWAPPIITKAYTYEENNDVNNMYIY